MDIVDAARYTIHLAYNVKGGSLTPLKMQKILYLAQGWSYVWDDTALFDDEFEAWRYGPVNMEVYDVFKKYGRDEIPAFEGNDSVRMTKAERETLEAVWDSYATWDAYALVELTHRQTPWLKNYTNGVGHISNMDIKQFFQSTY